MCNLCAYEWVYTVHACMHIAWHDAYMHGCVMHNGTGGQNRKPREQPGMKPRGEWVKPHRSAWVMAQVIGYAPQK